MGCKGFLTRETGPRHFKIGQVLHLKSEIADWTCAVQFKISDFGFEVQDSSNFRSLLGAIT
jgi:hypothetical protein